MLNGKGRARNYVYYMRILYLITYAPRPFPLSIEYTYYAHGLFYQAFNTFIMRRINR